MILILRLTFWKATFLKVDEVAFRAGLLSVLIVVSISFCEYSGLTVLI